MATEAPVIVSRSAGIFDALAALGRYITVIILSAPLLMSFLSARDFAGFIAYFQGDGGKQLIGAVVAAGTLLYGLFKTFHRGDQIASVAANPAVPDRVAQVT